MSGEPCYLAHLLSGYVKPGKQVGVKIDPFKDKTSLEVAHLIQANIDEIVSAQLAALTEELRVAKKNATARLIGLSKCGVERNDLRSRLAAAESKLDYADKMGLRFGMMKTSDKPEPYLTATWSEDSDHERIFKEWTHSIGWQAKLAATEEARDKAVVDARIARASRDVNLHGCVLAKQEAERNLSLYIQEQGFHGKTASTLTASRDAALESLRAMTEDRDFVTGERDAAIAREHEARGRVAELERDKERLDWLALQSVEVRTPLVYGSRHKFNNTPFSDDGEEIPWDIRAAIDAARNSGGAGK